MCTQETLFCIWSLYLNCQENLFLHREINKESQLTSRGAINFSALIIGSLGWSNQRHKKELRTCWTINIRKMMRLQRVKRCSPRKFFLPGLPIITKNYFKIFTTTLNWKLKNKRKHIWKARFKIATGKRSRYVLSPKNILKYLQEINLKNKNSWKARYKIDTGKINRKVFHF